MHRDPKAFLWDVQDSADAIAEFIAGQTYTDYTKNRMLRSAVERQFEIIGEALNQLSKTVPEFARIVPELPKIVAFRNLLIHGYAVVDDAVVWRTATQHLPELRQTVTKILDAPEQYPQISAP